MTNAVNLAAAAATGFFRNRLINGDFRVAQRGTTYASTGYGSVDRWRGNNTTTFNQVTVVPTGFKNSLRFASSSAVITSAEQRIEAINCYDLVGQKITVSLWAQNVSGTSPLRLALDYADALDNWTTQTNFVSQTLADSPATDWTFYSLTFDALPAGVANGLSLRVIRTNAAASDTRITGVQLEVGSVATPFERRSYGWELALCQRYYERCGCGAVGAAYSSTYANLGFCYNETKRAIPTMTLTTTTPVVGHWGVGSKTASGATIVGTDIGLNGAYIQINGFSGLTGGTGLDLSTDQCIALSAEL